MRAKTILPYHQLVGNQKFSWKEKWPARGMGGGWSGHEEDPVHKPINDQVSNKLESKVASPKKLKNPTTSVTVVNTMEED